MVLYSLPENPSQIRPVATDNKSANLVLCLLVSKCTKKNPGKISVTSLLLGKEL